MHIVEAALRNNDTWSPIDINNLQNLIPNGLKENGLRLLEEDSYITIDNGTSTITILPKFIEKVSHYTY